MYTQDVKVLPLKNFLGYDSFIGDNLKYEFAERNSPPISDTIATAATQWNTAGSIAGLSVTDATTFAKGDVVLTADAEIVIVSTVDEDNNQITVLARGDCGSTQSNANTDADALYIIGKKRALPILNLF